MKLISSLVLGLYVTLGATQPTLTIFNSSYSSISNGGDFIMYTNATTGYTGSMVYKGNELIKKAVGGYTGKTFVHLQKTY